MSTLINSMTLYILIGSAILIIGITIFLLNRKSKKSSDQEGSITEDKLLQSFDKSATQIVKEFHAYIFTPKSFRNSPYNSPYSRAERRIILRHYKKFIWEWPDLTRKQQSVDRICMHLMKNRPNRNVIAGYRSVVTGSFKQGE